MRKNEEEEQIEQQKIIKKTQQKLQKTGKLGNVIDKNENKSVDKRQVILEMKLKSSVYTAEMSNIKVVELQGQEQDSSGKQVEVIGSEDDDMVQVVMRQKCWKQEFLLQPSWPKLLEP